MGVIDKVKSQKKKPYSEKQEQECVQITSQERERLRSMIREREILKNETTNYYYFLFFFVFLLIIATAVLIAT